MRHRRSRVRLTQKPAHARLLQKNLVTSLFLYEEVRTTKSRARSIRPIVDRLIASAKKQDTHVAVRALNAFVTDRNASRKVMQVLVERYKARPSGFTSMKAVGSRKGDGAELVDLTLVDAELGKKEVVAEPKAKKPAKTTKTAKKATAETSDTPDVSTSSK